VFYRILLFFAVLLFILSFPKSKLAADEWQPIDPADLNMTSEPKAPGAPAIYLYRQVDRKEAGRMNHTEYNYVRIKILTEEGRKYANVEIPFSKGIAGINGIGARTVHPDGSVVNFNGKIFETTIVKSKSLKYLAKTFSIPDVQVGSIIEYHYTYDFEDYYIFSSNWMVSQDLFIRKAVFSLKPYERYPVQWNMPATLPPGSDGPKVGPDGVIRLTTVDVPAFVTEDHMPPEHELRFRVDFIYNQEGFDTNVDHFWKQYAKKQFDETEKFADKSSEMKRTLAEIISPSDAPDAKLRKIYARCQQIKNLDFMRSDERDKYDKLKNNNVEDVWKNQVASGKDVNLLFLALARAASFEAYYVRLSSRGSYFFNKIRMNTKELDADVILVKSGGQDLYLDPATKFAPYGLLPWEEAGVIGLRLDKQGGTWVNTVVPESSTSKIIRNADLKLNDDGSVEGTVEVSYTGLEALRLRLSERFNDDTQRTEDLEDALKDAIPVKGEVQLKNKPDWDSSDEKFVVVYDVKIPGWASSAGRRALFPLGLFSAAQSHTFEHAQRTYPIYFSFFFQIEDHANIKLPVGWKIDSLPKETHVDAKAAEYRILAESNAGELHVTRTLRSELLLLQVSVYPSLHAFYQQVRSGDKAQAVLLPGANSASN
jgi:Domain of Unknown Function with PDB structure (DUF3857)